MIDKKKHFLDQQKRSKTAWIDRTGQKFGRLTALSYNKKKDGKSTWTCLCDCGNIYEVMTRPLINGNTKSCGCLNIDNQLSKGTHNMSKSSEYSAWQGIKDRCHNEDNYDYDLYGGRGISVCDRWRYSFQNFIDDMGIKPTKKHSIDRWPDVNGNYEPSNCRWATPKQQANNRRSTSTYTINGVTKTLEEWLKESPVDAQTIRSRRYYGWSDYDCIFKPHRLINSTSRKSIKLKIK